MGGAHRRRLRPPLRPPVQAIGRTLKRTTATFLGALLLTTTACSSQTDRPEASPSSAAPSSASPSPSTSSSPTPPPVEPVVGTVEVGTVDASKPTRLGFADDGPPPEGSVQAAADAIAAALNAHLDAAQRGAADLATLGGEWLVDQDPGGAELLLTGLTNPDLPVARATYNLSVQVEPDPTVASALVSVARRDDTLRQVELVFDVAGDQPVLQLVGDPEVG